MGDPAPTLWLPLNWISSLEQWLISDLGQEMYKIQLAHLCQEARVIEVMSKGYRNPGILFKIPPMIIPPAFINENYFVFIFPSSIGAILLPWNFIHKMTKKHESVHVCVCVCVMSWCPNKLQWWQITFVSFSPTSFKSKTLFIGPRVILLLIYLF